ncbi:protein amnionless-like [Uranotaenia lowii]|uniref:protein amnionless-like n=1 Tax=Uranotaenia lowii TaxID=190385 RepID=UPI00247B0E41|nr:protein amnionless-like [Uranotaenia lowii]
MCSRKILILYPLILTVTSASKLWRFDLNFDNPSNWLSQSVPQHGQSIVFPAKLNALVDLPQVGQTESIVLPREGVVVIPETDFSLTFLADSSKLAPAVFKAPIRRPYYAAENWLAVDAMGNVLPEPNKAVPHLERIPCQFEEAVFLDPPGPIDLQYHEAVELKGVVYGKTSGLAELQQFFRSDLGQYVFYNAEDSVVREGKCASPEKCPCQPEWVADAVCRNEICPIPRCLNPIQPVGYCCAICGGVLTMDLLSFGGKFDLETFRKKLDRKITASEVDASAVEYHVSVQNDALQLVIVDKEEYDEISVELLKSLESFFAKQFMNSHRIMSSGHPYVPYQSGQLITVILFTLLIVSAFFTSFYVYYYDDRVLPRILVMIRNRQFIATPFVFARFDPNNEHEEGQSAVDINFSPSGIENLNSSFNNPMFEGNGANRTDSTKKDEQDESYVDVELESQK